MDKTGWLYVAACLVVPALWGVGSAWLFAKIDAKLDAKRSSGVDNATTNSPVDYSI